MKIQSLINWKVFGLLLTMGIVGTLSIYPYLITLQGDLLKELPFSLPVILLLSTLQTSIMLAITIFIGLLLARKVHLTLPFLEDWANNAPLKRSLKKLSLFSIKLGLLVGILIIGFDQVFSLFIEPITFISPPIWQGFLASFYGAIVEEILLRLFLMTLFVWIFSKFTRHSVWIAIILSSLLFGLGHLPATQLIVPLTPLIIIRAILLNGIGGVVFGWLYWKRGLESAMIAHFSVDIVLHVLFPTLLLII